MILVTGAAGFIGANFVLDWLAQSDEPVVNLDKLTYAGNLQTLASLKDNPTTPLCRVTSATALWSNACWPNTSPARW
jgi:dTDP-D-glucose 4,6-dehydratase